MRNTHFTVYWYIEGNTDLHNGDVIVCDKRIFVCDETSNTMNSSARSGVGGARHHNEISRNRPVDSKMLMFMLCIQLMEFCILNAIGNLVKNILYVCVHSVSKEVWDFCRRWILKFLWSKVHRSVSGFGRLRGGNRFQLRKNSKSYWKDYSLK